MVLNFYTITINLIHGDKMIIRYACIEELNKCLEFDHCKDIEDLKYRINTNNIIVAENNGKLVGYYRLEFIWGLMPYLALILVNEEFRKLGIGTSMQKFVEDKLVLDGCNCMLTSSVEDELEPQKWHKRNGFKYSGTLKGINGKNESDEVFFIKYLI